MTDRRRHCAALVAAATLLLATSAVAQQVCVVPGDHASIEQALSNTSCAIIDLSAPAYHEAVVISRAVELRGRGATRTSLSGRSASGQSFGTSVVTVRPGVEVTLSDLTVRDGRAPNGGGITNDGGQLTLKRCVVENNEATDAIGEGGGILNRAGGGLALIETTVRNNRARLDGGGISSSGLSVPLISDPATRQKLAGAFNKLRSLPVPDVDPFPTVDSLTAIGEAFVDVSEALVNAIGDLVTQGVGGQVDDSAPTERTRTTFLESGFTALAVANSVIEHNTVEAGVTSGWGGGIHADQGFIFIENSRISDNEVNARLGAFGSGLSAALSVVLITNSELMRNAATSQTVVAGGGAIWNLAGAVDVQDSHLDENSATSFFLNHGGALQNMGGVARVLRSTLEGNQSGNGGGITNHYMGDLTVEDSGIRNNVIDGVISAFGGGINNEKGGTTTIRRSAITGNMVLGRSRGGGVYSESAAESIDTTVAGQPIQLPLWNTSRMTIENTTISGNVVDGRKVIALPFDEQTCTDELIQRLRAGVAQATAQQAYQACLAAGGESTIIHLPARGGGIYTGSQAVGIALTTLRNSTVAFNQALGNQATGGGIYGSLSSGLNALSPGLSTDINVESALVTKNAPRDCDEFEGNTFITIHAERANLDSDGTCRNRDADFTTGNPLLLPLSRYGGPTVTHALPVTSLAKDRTSNCPATDQRGESRALGGVCDIGAFELTPPRGVSDFYSGQEDAPITAAGEAGVLANDMGLGLGQATVVTPPQHGTVTLQPDGTFVYTPHQDYFGADHFTYRATDLSAITIGPIDVTVDIAGRLDVLAVDPAQESVASRQPTINVDFDDPMSIAGVAGRVFLYGDRSELQPRAAVPAANLAVSGSRLSITAPREFAPGERLTLVLTDLVSSALDIRLPHSLVTEIVTASDGGGGGFGSPVPFGNMIGSQLALGDLDGDGDLDAVTASTFTAVSTRVWTNAGGGYVAGQELTFSDGSRTVPFHASGLALGDLDGDGDLDLLATTSDVAQFAFNIPARVHTRAFFNDGNAGFTESDQDFISGSYRDPASPAFDFTAAHRAVALGDLDGDGDLDAYIVAGTGNFGARILDGARADSVWLNSGGGQFSRFGGSIGFDHGEAVALGDADGDGDLDALVANSLEASRLWLNDSIGNFSRAAQALPSATDIAVGDFNADSHLDLALVGTTDNRIVWLGDGTGAFSPALIGPTASRRTTCAVGDVDSDGDLDVYLGRGFRYEFLDVLGEPDQVWLNDGQANFTGSRQAFPSDFTSAAALGDVNGDDILDVVATKIGSQTTTIHGFDWQRAAPTAAEIRYGLQPPVTMRDSYATAEDTTLVRNAAAGVLANDAAPGAVAIHDSRLDTYAGPNGHLGELIHLLSDLGIHINDTSVGYGPNGYFATHNVLVGLPAHGTVTLAGDGSFTYVPDADFTGADTFTYIAQTPAADSRPETVTINVTPVNDAPVAVSDSHPYSAAGVTVAAAGGVLVNDSDVDGDPLTAVLSTAPFRGSVTLNTDGSFVYSPDPVQTGGDVFYYRARDPNGASSSPARVKLGNSMPVAQAEAAYTPAANGSLSVAPGQGVLANDTDPDGDALTSILVTPPRHGIVDLHVDGSFSYTPGPGWSGSDVFFYAITDGIDTTAPIRVKIGNTAPVARNDGYVTGRNIPLSIAAPGVIANDTDFDSDALTATLATTPSSGQVQFHTDGSFVYTPAIDVLGDATFTYTTSDGLASSQATVTVGVFDELNIVGRTPLANVIGAPADTDVSIEFDQTVVAATTAGRVRLTGAQTGSHASTLSTANRVVTANPADDFFPGERVTVSALAGIQGSGTTRLSATKSWRFDVETAMASGQLEDSGQALGSTEAKAVALGDLDDDGDLDAFVAGSIGGPGSAVWRNDGQGILSFDTASDLSNLFANDVALGDLDGDGDLDAFTPNGPVFNVAGRLEWSPTLPEGLDGTGQRVRLADVDGDGDLDAVVGTSDANRGVLTLLNDGAGDFTLGSELAAGSVRALALGDIDGDGAIDVVKGDSDGVRAWLNNGSGAFTTELAVNHDANFVRNTSSLDLGDLDSDGDLDVLAGGVEARRVYLNDGSGTLTQTNSAFFGDTAQLALGDFDGDGDLDAFIATGGRQDQGKRPHEVWLNDGDGVFTEGPRAPTHPDRTVAVALGDLDGDGDLDAFAGTNFQPFIPAPARVLLNRTTVTGPISGRFADSTQRLGNGSSADVELVDLDGDGDLDAYVSNRIVTIGSPTSLDQIWFNDGSGGFVAGPTDTLRRGSRDAAFTDVNGDESPDLLLLSGISRLFLNDGTGNLVAPAIIPFAGIAFIRLGDLDGDGDVDAVGAPSSTNDVFFLFTNDGSGQFTKSAPLTRPVKLDNPSADSATIDDVAIFDADGDEDLDLYATTALDEHTLWINDGEGGFSPDDTLVFTISPFGLRAFASAGDVDGDDDIDLLVTGYSLTPGRIRLNDGAGNFTDGQTFNARTSGQAAKLVDVDADGDQDAVFARTDEPAEFWINDGLGNFVREEGFIGTDQTEDFAFGDLDDDGDQDAFVGRGSPNVLQPNEVWLNTTLNPATAVKHTGPVATGDDTEVHPFAAVVVTAPAGSAVSLNVSADSLAPGTLSAASLTAAGFSGPATGPWTRVQVSPAVATAALRALVFSPIENRAPVGTQEGVRFTIVASTADDSITDTDTVITITSINDAPLTGTPEAFSVVAGGILNVSAPGLLANDVDVDAGDVLTAVLIDPPAAGDLAVLPNGSLVYVPRDAANGVVHFTYRVSDGRALSLPVIASITISGVNRAPAGGADTFTVNEDATLTVPAPGVLGNDADPDNGPLQALLVGSVHGQVTLNPNGGFVYTPEENFSGTDTFTYRASDGQLRSDPVLVTIHVNPVNDSPIGAADSYGTDEDATLDVPGSGVLANDFDADGDALSAQLVQPAGHGNVTLGLNGSLRYVPDAGYEGADQFTYRATDGTATSDPVVVSLNVAAIADRPAGVLDVYLLDEDDALDVPAAGLLANDSDPENEPLAAAPLTQPSHGSVNLRADGSFTYTPEADYQGTDAFTYEVRAGTRTSVSVPVLLDIAPINDTPEAMADAYELDQDGSLTVGPAGVLANDVDTDADSLHATLTDSPTHGTLTLGDDGGFTYSPDAYFFGTDTFKYRASDAAETSAAVAVTLTVRNVRCGNTELDPTEQCDDWNKDDADGCSAVCQLEPGAVVSGPGRATDCKHGWLVTPEPERRTRVRCTDGDPSCDMGVPGDGMCHFRVALCFNIADTSRNCASRAVRDLRLLLPTFRPRATDDDSNRSAIEDALVGLGAQIQGTCLKGAQRGDACRVNADCDSSVGGGDGVCQRTAAFQPAFEQENQCTASTLITVPLRDGRRGAQTVRVRATSVDRDGRRARPDGDTVRLICEPPS